MSPPVGDVKYSATVLVPGQLQSCINHCLMLVYVSILNPVHIGVRDFKSNLNLIEGHMIVYKVFLVLGKASIIKKTYNLMSKDCFGVQKKGKRFRMSSNANCLILDQNVSFNNLVKATPNLL